jgi:tRNA A37 methylthiotransferase MiaB
MGVYSENKKSVYISTAFECPLRILDAAKLRNYFSLNNCELVNTFEDADCHIYITCSAIKPNVTNQLDSIKEIQKSSGELIVMGCLPGTNEEDLKTVFSGKTITTKNICDIDKHFPDFRIKYNEIPEVHHFDFGKFILSDLCSNNSVFSLVLKFGLSKTFLRQIYIHRDFKSFVRSNKDANTTDPCFLIISSGCANNCSYCNIREAIGKVKSKSIDRLVEEYSGLLKQGYRLFHFVAEDICSYGLDIKSSLAQLLWALSAADKAYQVKWSLDGVNPGWLVKFQHELTPLVKSKKIWEITLSVENGSDRIIELMNRHYKIKEVENALGLLRKINPGLRINALFIEGFPSETEEDFNETLNFLQKARFDNVTISVYSEFETRASAKIFPKVSDEVIQERMLRAKKLLHSIKTPVIRGDLKPI